MIMSKRIGNILLEEYDCEMDYQTKHKISFIVILK